MIRRFEREPIGQIEAIWLPIGLHSFEPRPAFLADVFAHELPVEAAVLGLEMTVVNRLG